MPPLFFTEKSPLCCIACYYVLYEHVIFKFWLCNFYTASRAAVHVLVFSVALYSCFCVISVLFVTKNLLQPPAMATIMKRGVKRRLAEVSQREDKLKLKRQVYEEIEKLKSQNKNRGIFAIVARQLALTDDQVRNHYKAEQKLVKRRGGSSQEYIDLSGGEPTTIVIFLLF